MARRSRASFRLWQTELFLAVIVVAILILSGSLSAGLMTTLTQIGQANELRNASALALRLEPDFRSAVASSSARMRQTIFEYRRIYGSGIWVYDRTGRLVDASFDASPAASVLSAARRAGLADNPPFATMDLRPGGWVVAAKVIHGPAGTRDGVVVTASPVADSLTILDSVRKRLWTTFWISLVVAGLLGFAFSEVISRRIRAMSGAAAAIAAGDFEQRLPISLAPNEIHDLAISYNQMAAKLGEAFSQLQEREREITAVVESMAEGVIAFDAAGIVRVINPEAARLIGAEMDTLAGKPVHEIGMDPAVISVVDASLSGRKADATAAAGDFTVLAHATPLLDPDGGVDGAVLLLADVTERQRIEDAQRRFVADASHELRTPIAALNGFLELLADGAKDDPAVLDDFIHTMQVEADRLGRLVSELLTLAHLEAGNLVPEIVPTSVATLFSDVTNVMRPLAEQAGTELSEELPESDIDVLADRDRIVQVLLGFVDNALKHSPRGTTVRLKARVLGDDVVLEVCDEGPGIEAEQLDHVFDRFYRADEARVGGGGTGLGLAIAKEIVEAHGSVIEAHSTPGQGSSFGFHLPIAPRRETLTQP